MADVTLTAAQAMATWRGPADSQVGSHIAAAALPAAGAFTTQDAVDLATGSRRVAFWISYTKNGSATTGGPKFWLEWTDDDGNTGDEPVNNATFLTPSEPRAAMKHYLGEWDGPIFDATTPSGRWPLTFEVPPGARKVRLRVAEAVDTANPGTVQVEIAASGSL